MKALLLKDFYVIWKQMGIFLVVVLLMSLVNSTFNCVFLMVWSSMLPYTSMAYDGQSHWDQLAAMMPYSRRDMVLSKYVLGWLCMGAMGLISLVMQTVVGRFISGSATGGGVLLMSLCMGAVSLAITLPAVLRFGVERGRMIFLVVIFGVAIGAGILLDASDLHISLPLPLEVLAPLAAVAATAVSIPLSMKLYRVD